MGDVDWGDDDDALEGIDWDAQEAAALSIHPPHTRNTDETRGASFPQPGTLVNSHHPHPHPRPIQHNGYAHPKPAPPHIPSSTATTAAVSNHEVSFYPNAAAAAQARSIFFGGPSGPVVPPQPQQQHAHAHAPHPVLPMPQHPQQVQPPAVQNVPGKIAIQTHGSEAVPAATYQPHQGADPQQRGGHHRTEAHAGAAAAAASAAAPPPPPVEPFQYQHRHQPAVHHQLHHQQHSLPGNLAQHSASTAMPAAPPKAAPLVTLYASLELPRAVSRGSNGGANGSCGSATNANASNNDSATGGSDPGPHVEVRMGWHNAAYSALKRLGCGSWDARRRAWLFPLNAHDRIVETLHSVQEVKVKVEPLHALPAAVLKASAAIPDDSSRYCHIPTTLESQLMQFQRDGVKFGLRHGGRCLIGDEMGLGKTVQAIALAAAYRDEWPGLIIAPSSLREQWADALHKWLGVTEDRVHVVHTGKDAENIPQRGLDFLILSYNFLDKLDLAGKYRMVIVDESHYIKDGAAKRTKAALPVLKEAKRCMLLTGTPALNRPKEVYTQLSALLPAAKIKMRDFGERYCSGNRFDKYGGAQNLEELHSMLRGSIMVRRLKADVLSQLPQKRRQQVFLSLDATARKELSALSKQLEAVKAVLAQLAAVNAASNGAAGLGGARSDENRAIMEMYRRTADLKGKAVQEYVEMLLDAGQKFLIFAHHTSLMDAIEHVCNRRKGCRTIRIDGKTPPSDRSRLVSSFQNDEGVKVAILSIRAAGVGLTLTAASTVVFAEMTWTPGEIIQAEDRAHRIGQASAVNVYYLHVRGSVDDIIWAAVQNKLENVGQALDGHDRGMEVSAAKTMPERGQKSLHGFFNKAPTQPQSDQQNQQQQQQQLAASGTGPMMPREAANSAGPMAPLPNANAVDDGAVRCAGVGVKRQEVSAATCMLSPPRRRGVVGDENEREYFVARKRSRDGEERTNE